MFRRALTELFIGSRIPLSHVDQEYFRKAFNIADKSLKVPCRSTISNEIDKLYAEDRNELKEALSNVKFACATADLWTSYQRSFLGMTISWLHPETLERKNDVMSCVRIMGSKTFDIIAAFMKDSLDSVGARGKVSITVVDGGKNIRKAIE